MKARSLGISLVFVAGCAVGGASARFVVPPANAQQAATLTKWEYTCVGGSLASAEIQEKANAAGAQAWEMSGAYAAFNGASFSSVSCFKRPKL